MWFKNLRIYRGLETFDYQPETLALQLAKKPFMPANAWTVTSYGWVSPVEEPNGPLVYAANGIMLICLQVEEKLLPATIINQHLKVKIQEIESQQDRKVSRKQRIQLKEEIYQQLLPKAFSKINRYYAYFDCQRQLFVVDTSQLKKTEFLITTLRATLGTLKIEPLLMENTGLTLTKWLRQGNPSGFSIMNNCLLQDPKLSAGKIRISEQDLHLEEIQTFLKHHYFVSQLHLNWREQLSFFVAEDGSLRRLKFLESVKEIAHESFSASAAQRFDTNFAIMSGTVGQLLDEWVPYCQDQAIEKQATDLPQERMHALEYS